MPRMAVIGVCSRFSLATGPASIQLQDYREAVTFVYGGKCSQHESSACLRGQNLVLLVAQRIDDPAQRLPGLDRLPQLDCRLKTAVGRRRIAPLHVARIGP